jgi:adenosylhomocysteine nucleosidase
MRQAGGMLTDRARQVVILAPMPLEMAAITTAFGLKPTGDGIQAPWTGRVGESDVRAVHIGMGPARTREATIGLLEEPLVHGRRVDHVMIAGICGGLDPDLPVGTLINPEILVEHATGLTWHHRPPGDEPLRGKLVTTETVSLDVELSLRFFADGCLAVDMESSAVAEACEPRGVSWSVYRCIGDRHFDGLLDARLVALTNPDGSVDRAAIQRLLAEEPEMAAKLEQLSRDAARAAQLAAEAALQGCRALDAWTR